MRRPSSCVVALAALVLLWATPGRADPNTITITSGHADFEPNLGNGKFPPMVLQGTDGFSLIAGLGIGNTGPGCCFAPGETLTFHGSWTGGDVSGIATHAGDQFTDVGAGSSVNQATVEWVSDSFVAPALGPLTTTVIAPVTFSGNFQGRPGNGSFQGGPPTLFATLTGRGIGQLTLTALSDNRGSFVWEPGLVHIDMMAPTPEPTSLVLLGLGVAGTCLLRRRNERAAE
jgi:PEP-CTERM motif